MGEPEDFDELNDPELEDPKESDEEPPFDYEETLEELTVDEDGHVRPRRKDGRASEETPYDENAYYD
jgi:hypothetical protein